MKALVLLYMLFIICLCGCQHTKNSQMVDDSKNFESRGADIIGADDPMETNIVIKVGSIGMNIKGKANFYRGYINKETLAAEYQLYIQTKERQWMYWDEARYLAIDGLKRNSLVKVGTDVKCSQWGCAHYEDIILKVDPQTLKDWSKKETVIRLTSSKVDGNKDIDINEENTLDFLNAMEKTIIYLKNKKKIPINK